MRIWIDMTNSPHVMFFAPIIKALEKEGHSILVTSREHSQTTELLRFHRINSIVIGKHAGSSMIRKAFLVPVRVFSLVGSMRGKRIDVCVVHQSFYGIIAAFLLGIKKRIYIFDNERAFWQNFLAVPFATQVICPGAISQSRLFSMRLKKYPGIKESIYLSDFSPDRGILKKLGLSAKKKIIVMRPEPYSAAYYSGKKNVLFPLIQDIIEKRPDWQVVLIPRDAEQRRGFNESFGKKIIVTEDAIDAPSLLYHAGAMIGAGGTMNREAAVLGVPVISLYGEKLLAVDKWLISQGFMKHAVSVSIADIDSLISLKKEKRQLADGRKAILGTILN